MLLEKGEIAVGVRADGLASSNGNGNGNGKGFPRQTSMPARATTAVAAQPTIRVDRKGRVRAEQVLTVGAAGKLRFEGIANVTLIE